MQKRYVVKIGEVYGRLTVVGRSGKPKNVWLCSCECGNKKEIPACALATGHIKSCGCYKKSGDFVTKHSHARYGTKSPTYQTWQHMLRRCLVPTDSNYKNYGGAGIRICNRWLVFANFLEDMGERPHGKTLDRYPDKKGDYEIGNCRWATPAQQMQNSRKAKLTDVLVKEIRAFHGIESSRKVARRYGVSGCQVSAIWRGVAWKE